MSDLNLGGKSSSGISFGDGNTFDPTERDRQLREWLFHDVLGDPVYGEFAKWLKERLVIDGFELPISQVLGFGQYLAKTHSVDTNQSTTSTAFGDLTTVGPQFTGATALADGIWLFLYGANINVDGTNEGYMGLSVNGSTPTVSQSARLFNSSTTVLISVATIHARLKTLQSGSNSAVCKYATSVAGIRALFASRFLIAVRVGNT